jgi:hypothetical protein
MKRPSAIGYVALGLLLGLFLVGGGVSVVRGQSGDESTLTAVGTGFTYQGQLQSNGDAVDDTCDFRFNLWDAPTIGNQIGGTQEISGVPVTEGRFTVTLNDGNEFGDEAFDGSARWLRVRVRCPAGGGSYTALSPRQALRPAPYALSLRPGAAISGTVPAATGALNVGSDWYGLRVDNAGSDGINVVRAERNGLEVVRALGDGLRIDFTGSVGSGTISSENNGVEIAGVEGKGIFIGESGTDGIVVDSAGDPSTTNSSSYDDGLEVRGAAGFGAYVGRADLDGFYVQDVTFDGFQVQNAGDNGVEVNGATDLAGYFNGNVDITGTCTGCAVATFGLNMDGAALQPGDVVTVRGVRQPQELAATTGVILEVGLAQDGDSVVGVVRGWAEMDRGDEAQTLEEAAAPHLVPREGAAQPGAYVTIITHGVARVNVDSDGAQEMVAGARLAAGEEGRARALRTTTVDGVTVAEAAPAVGIVLQDGPEAGADGVWVLVNPQ